MTRSKVVLGQKVFVLSPDGEVVRTMVAEISREHYTMLNGYTSHEAHWTSFVAAVGAAREVLERRRAALRKTLRQLAAKDRALQAADYKRAVMSAPYKVVDLGYDETRSRTRMRKHVPVPETYLAPGQLVYAIITPMIKPSAGWAVYRPYSHFVLETEIQSVRLSPSGTARYTFGTHYPLDEYFLSREEAETKLQSYSEPGTLEPVYFVSREEEKKELDELQEDDIPF